MIQFERIKLIIWDLDETFWKGTLSEESVQIPEEHIELLETLTDIGIVNSICSKNYEEDVRRQLEADGLWELFVFPSINWESKGSRIQQMISAMQLRPVNVLFLDDNPSNQEEVRYHNPDIMTGGPELIPELLREARNALKKDSEHKRLNQYKVLEEKYQEKQTYSSNEDFLRDSRIQVEISHDWQAHLERIHELILRSNQLNFTKVRSSKEELDEMLRSEGVESGYVTVEDRFGDYGISGFYALRNGVLEHFVFSCRILGMGVEQYVYNMLGRPELEPVQPVISDLSSETLPDWINSDESSASEEKLEIDHLEEHMVLIKGPCDLFQIYPYIAGTELFDTEFTYTTDAGLVIESTGHTTHLVEAGRLTESQKQLVLGEVPFTDAGMYNDYIYRFPYKVVVISILTDANLGVYRRKETGERFAFLEYNHPITDPANWDGLINGRYRNGGFRFTETNLRQFAEKYEYIGRNTPEQIVKNLKYVREQLSRDCTMVVMLGGELCYEKNTSPAYSDRHLVHRKINQAIRAYASGREDVLLIDVNRYLKDQSSFYDHFNHYIKPVYYNLAKELVDIVNARTGSHVKQTAKSKMLLIRMKEIAAPVYHRIRSFVREKH